MSTPSRPENAAEAPADRSAADCLHAAGLLDAGGRQVALDLVLEPRRWALWTERLLAALGAVLVLAGVVYFFAFNWAELSRHAKLALAGLGLLLTLARPLVYGTEDPVGKILVCAAGMMVGVFLAVFGQVYQTGADAYELFVAWGALILGWAALARSAPLWILLAVIVNLAVVLYVDQTAPLSPRWEALVIALLIALDGAALAAREVAVSRGAHWLASRWTRYVLGYAVVFLAFLPLLEIALRPQRVGPGELVAGLVAFGAHVAVAWFYRRRQPDLGMLGAIALSACIVLEVALFQVLEDWWRSVEALAFFAMAGITIAIFAAAVSWLRKVSAHIDAERARG